MLEQSIVWLNYLSVVFVLLQQNFNGKGGFCEYNIFVDLLFASVKFPNS